MGVTVDTTPTPEFESRTALDVDCQVSVRQ